jgi:hypothetical protein
MGGGMKRERKNTVVIFLAVAAAVLSLSSCEDFALKQTIDEIVLGWSRQITLTAPADDELRAEKTPLLEWEAAGGAATYKVQISESADFTGVEKITVTEPQYEIPDPLVISDERFWRVCGVNAEGVEGEWSDTWSFVISPATTLERVASVSIGTGAYRLFYDEGYCYVPTSAGLYVIDATDPLNPVDVSPASFSAFTDQHASVVKKNNYLYIVDPDPSPDILYVYDATDPENPVQLSLTTLEYDPDGGVESFNGSWMAMWSNILYIIGDLDTVGWGLLGIEVSDPSNPSITDFEKGSVSTYALELAVNGNYAYAMMDDVGVDVYDVTDMSKIATYSIPSMDRGFIHFKGNYAFTTNQKGPYEIIEILNPGNPVNAATFDPEEFTAGGFVIGYFAFVFGISTFNMYVLDIRDVSNPVLLNTVPGEGLINAISGNYGFELDFDSGNFKVIDLVPGD